MDSASPDSPLYGKHYSADEVIALFEPAESTMSSVKNWLIEAGVPAAGISQSANKGWVQFDSKTSDLESLLKTKYHVYENTETGRSHVACDEYHVPEHIQEHVDYITPGIKLLDLGSRKSGNRPLRPIDEKISPISPEGSVPAAPAGCDTQITPTCVRSRSIDPKA